MKTSKQKKSVLAVDIGGKPTVISLFAGTGGSSLGYHWAGYRELLAVDFDSHAVECFKLNFPDVPIWKKSVTEITGKEILEFCSIGIGELDVLDGSPPCQGFSTAGKRDVLDPRNDLFRHYVRLINELQPRVFVMENVSGMVKGKMKGRFIEIMGALKETGYNVRAKQMNAVNYGVPQSRERIIFIGCKSGDVSFPSKKKKPVSVKEAIGRDGYIEYRRCYSKGSVKKGRSSFCNPCLTITKTMSGWTVHPVQFTEKELKILCSFPEDWKMTGTFAQKWARLGNAVMPKFMQAIAENIKINILDSSGDV